MLELTTKVVDQPPQANRDASQQKAEMLLEALVSLLHSPTHFSKFSAALPFTRILLLLLGEQPSAIVAQQVLILVGLATKVSSSFARKFELVSGWTVLKTVLPLCWDSNVQQVVLDAFVGRIAFKGGRAEKASDQSKPVSCPQLLPAIFSGLQKGLTNPQTKDAQDPKGGKYL